MENGIILQWKNCQHYSVEMPNQNNKILKCNHGENSMKVPFLIYADVESLLEKMSTCHNNAAKSSATKINKHKPSGYSLFTHCSFDSTKTKLDCYRGKDGMERFFHDLKQHATKKKLWKKEMIPWTNEENIIYANVIYAKKDLVLMITIWWWWWWWW